MFQIRISLAIGFCLALGILLSGCGTQEVLPTPVLQVKNVAVPQDFAPQTERQKPTEIAEADAATGDPEEKPSVPEPVAAAAYEPPFPDRIDLFVAPRRQGRGIKKTLDGFESAIELLGFVNVDGQRVVLSIDGLVSSLAVGSQEAGIEVISIQPPAVVLQRGRQRWQATLEN